MVKQYIRKLGKIGRTEMPSYHLTLPKELVHELGWREGENISIRRAERGTHLILEPIWQIESRNDR